MAQNQDPFSLQFSSVTPASSLTFQPPDDVGPPLPPRPPPRPKRRPVPAPQAATSQPAHESGPPSSTTRDPQFEALETSPSNLPPSFTSPNFIVPAPGYGSIPLAAGYGSIPSAPCYDPIPSTPGYSSIPPAVSAQVAASPGSAEPKSKKRHSFFGSAIRQFAKVAFPEYSAPGPSTTLAFDNPAVPYPQQSASSSGSYDSQVVVNGVKLGQEDLNTLRAVVYPVLPGSYWYDRISGAYGTAGGPCTGFLWANLPLGSGPLASDASGQTGTGVFINGRELHTLDVAGLQRMGAVVMPGRWWLSADGSYGAEGSFAVLGNLRMQANAANNAGGAHTWSTSMGNYGGSDGQGFCYVGGPGWSCSVG